MAKAERIDEALRDKGTATGAETLIVRVSVWGRGAVGRAVIRILARGQITGREKLGV